ncbi:MAG: response regulator [Deltaproteobacteria bacterium]|nr:response regulator [Deltaproteobacteria bacterium]
MNNVLVIDDEKMIASMLGQVLTRYGYSVETALGGLEGIRMFEAGSFDLVITDIRMPDIDGHEVSRCIRSSDKPHTPIIAMSGTPWLMKGNGFDCTIPKPFSIQTLIDAVKELTLIPLNSDKGYINDALT